MKKGTCSSLILIVLILIGFSTTTNVVYSSAYYLFDRSVKIGSDYVWTVTKCKHTNYDGFFAYNYTNDFFEEGDKFKVKITHTPSSSSWDNTMGSISWMEFYKNDVLINQNTLTMWIGDFAKILTHHTYIYRYGFIYPIAVVEEGRARNYFEQYYELIENGRYSSKYPQKLTKRYYEVSDDSSGIIYYRKYSVRTGVLAVFRETFEMEGYESHIFEIVNYNHSNQQIIYFIPLFVLVLIELGRIIRVKKLKKKREI